MMMSDRALQPASPAVTDRGLKSRENAEMQQLREALGAIAVGRPAVYWLYLGEDARWYLRREGDPDEQVYATRDEAVESLHLAVLRCASYCLFLQDGNGRFRKEFFKWPSSHS
jgi:hypothetical protein